MKPQITVRGQSVYLGEVEVGDYFFSAAKTWTWEIISGKTSYEFTEQAAQEAIIKAVQAWLKKAGLPEAEVIK